MGTTSSTAQRVAAELRTRLRGGEWEEGEQLPTLDDLCGQYDTSGPTMRRAQAILRAEGWVRSEQGRGVFVLSPPAEGLSDQAQSLAETVASLRTLVDQLDARVESLKEEVRGR